MLDLMRDRGVGRKVGRHGRAVLLRERDGLADARIGRRRVAFLDVARGEERVEEFFGVRDQHLSRGELLLEANRDDAVTDERAIPAAVPPRRARRRRRVQGRASKP